MADNLNEPAVEDEENIEEIVDHETEAAAVNEPEAEIQDPDEPNIDFMNKVTGQLLGRWDLQPTRETIKLIATTLKLKNLNLCGVLIYHICNCINDFEELERLDLIQNNLTALPDDLNLPQLRAINMEDNKFTSFPLVLTQHKKLHALFMGHNELTELPDELNLPDLKELNFGNNKLSSYPIAFNQLFNVEVIGLQDNQITDIPEDSFKKNVNLKTLILKGNPLVQIPSCIMNCGGLIRLEIQDCKLTSIPEWFGKKFRNLNEIYITQNPDLIEFPNSIRFVKDAIHLANKFLRLHHPELKRQCYRVEVMLKAVSDRVWNTRKILLTARPHIHVISRSKDSDDEYDNEEDEGNLSNQLQHCQLNEFQYCHEVLFGGDEDRRKYLIRKILTYLI